MVGHQAKNLTRLVTKKVHELNDDDLRTHIEKRGIERYKQSCKTLQVDTIASLVRGNNTFLLAATGFGKTRIAELYLDLMPKDKKGRISGVVIVLNPLDALGDNQVEEKKQADFSAINITKSNFDSETADDIKNGVRAARAL
ncbi:hypothetical protein PGT21_028752 [Puccinia graminis f. sp. tritici]|uniref:DNA 3'-5' helicase n=1 Tax=Puccinia graminis f. sp. tritici TaxID=56615 RepID=A0A5B0SBQ4_PUCGR|nr:hypothetical protein PGT21_028752 [Puccinia graminis f. sp. tritici]KAA1135250.1 hypothetical protein PGTUg99_022050 [Puccinia graminis f. sp. tritici]